MSEQSYSTTIFSVPFSGFAVSSTGGASAFDLWSIKASSLGRMSLEGIDIGQLSTQVSANQQLAITVYRGSTALGGGGDGPALEFEGVAYGSDRAQLSHSAVIQSRQHGERYPDPRGQLGYEWLLFLAARFLRRGHLGRLASLECSRVRAARDSAA